MRMWQIREGYDPRYGERHGGDEVKEAYECGYEEGYGDAMKEVYGERGNYGNRGGRVRYGNREDEDMQDMGERRRRRY